MNWNDTQVQEGSPRLREGSSRTPRGWGRGEPVWPPRIESGGSGRTAGSWTSSGLCSVLAAIPHLVPSSCCPGLCLPPNLSVMQSHEEKKNGELDQIHNRLRTEEQQQSVPAFR